VNSQIREEEYVDNEHLQKVLDSYNDKFETFNSSENHEIYKWTEASQFQKYWDLDAEDFGTMFKNAMDGDEGLISESSYQPINGVIFMCKHSHDMQEQVRDEFRKLMEPDDSDYAARQKRAEAFVTDMNSLLKMIDADKWKYHQEISSALMYLSYADPEDNFLYKENEVKAFIQYVGEDENIVTDDSVDLPKYYHMCSQIVEELQQRNDILEKVDQALQDEADNSDDSSVTEVDSDNHILAFDVIYCALNYELYDEMPSAPKKKKRKRTAASIEAEAREKEAARLKKEIRNAKAELKKLNDKRESMELPTLEGSSVNHKKYGKGTVSAQDGAYLTVKFEKTEKKFKLPDAVTKGFLKFDDDNIITACKAVREADDEIHKQEVEVRALEVQFEGSQE
jgi:hypothetical protein